MRKSTRSALLSGLVFPGIGHLVLKQYRRGWILMGLALTTTTIIVTVAVKQALAVIERIGIGEIPMDAGTLALLSADSANGSAGEIANIALIVLGLCWLFGIIDSYKLGIKQEQETDQF